mmetsp:Transcript_91511/g.191301  ORF Transcript_91511/g.191301 Transcript_91511/m.191301 type:complete len:110 (+) Transcript_91511:47-376(+)
MVKTSTQHTVDHDLKGQGAQGQLETKAGDQSAQPRIDLPSIMDPVLAAEKVLLDEPVDSVWAPKGASGRGLIERAMKSRPKMPLPLQPQPHSSHLHGHYQQLQGPRKNG